MDELARECRRLIVTRQPTGAANPSVGSNVPRERQVLHRHADARLVLFLDGDVHEEVFGKEAHFQRGDFVFRPPYFAHMDRAGANGSSYLRLPVSRDRLRHWIEKRGWKAGRGRVDLAKVNWRRLVGHMTGGDQLLDLASADGHDIAVPTSGIRHVARLLDGLEAPRFDSIAEQMELAPYQLTRRFASAFGVSPRAYRRQSRLQRAMAKLVVATDTLAHIAVEAGFFDQSHLHRELKRETGLTPQEFRGAVVGA